MTTAVRREHESFENLFKRFRTQVQQDRILKELRQRRFFEKPSQTRKRAAIKKLVKSRRTTRKYNSRAY
jgi:small subunit ribosomal protein S21